LKSAFWIKRAFSRELFCFSRSNESRTRNHNVSPAIDYFLNLLLFLSRFNYRCVHPRPPSPMQMRSFCSCVVPFTCSSSQETFSKIVFPFMPRFPNLFLSLFFTHVCFCLQNVLESSV
jgi:hypothetical protein